MRSNRLTCWLTCLACLTLFSAGWAQEPELVPIGDLIAAAGTVEDHPTASVVVVFDRTEIEVEDSGLSHVVNHRVTKILTRGGARDQAMLRFDYDPATQAVEIRRVNVYRQDGSVEAVDLGGVVDVSAPARGIYWGGRMRAVQLPRLLVGDAVEFETYRKGFQIAYLTQAEEFESGTVDDESKYIPPMEGHFYDVVLFQGGDPIREKTYTLRTPRDKPIQFSVYNGEVYSSATFDDTHHIYRFWKEDVPAGKREWRSPAWSDIVPKVVLATVQDWEAKSRWFWDANQDQFADNLDIRALVAEITAGMRSDTEKIAAINHWAAQEIRYCGLNMGEGEGYTLHPGPMIFTERSGVCKDIAGMAITMLRSAGYEVYPAMTMAGSRVERIPADQFNHCVAALRKPDGSYEMLDPTWIPFASNNWSRAEGEQQFVIGTPWGEDLMTTPPYRAEDNRVELKVTGKVATDGSLEAEITLVAAGYADTRLRRSVGFVPKAQHRARLERWVGNLAENAELVEFAFGDHRDFDRPLTLTLQLRIPRFALVGADYAVAPSCGTSLVMANYGGLFRFAARDLPAEREGPALIWYPQEVRIEETLRWPSGFLARPVPGEWQCGDEESIASCRFTTEPRGNTLRIDGTVQVENRTIRPDQWPAFRDAVEVLNEFSHQQLVATRKGA